MEYKPDIIISVHPLMQHIPLIVLKWQRLQEKVIFVTVITDLNTCHRTWLVVTFNSLNIDTNLLQVLTRIQFCTRFHPRVNRCYCPSNEVARRAVLDGLMESKTRVFGLPVRPSFCQAVFSKVGA